MNQIDAGFLERTRIKSTSPARERCMGATMNGAGVLLILAGIVGSAAPALADGPSSIPGPVPAEYLSAYDGDTVTVRAWIWPGQWVGTVVRVRGIDTPEIRGNCESEKQAAIAARDYARALLRTAGEVGLAEIEPDKYGARVVATLLVDGKDFATLMMAAGHGRPYDGRRRESWCGGIVQ